MTRRSGTLRAEDLEPLAVFLGHGPSVGAPSAVDAVPPCWHWCLLLDPVDPSRLDDDGYPIGGPITPEPGMTRMFAGGRVTCTAPLELDSPTSRRTRVARTTDKVGRHGPLRFVTLESVWAQDGRTRLVDEQDYVFTPTAHPSDTATSSSTAPSSSTARSAAASPQTGRDPSATLAEGRILVTEPMLVAFSGLTANPYRIHWDKDFCARSGHDGLVVHGPLQALWLAEEFSRRGEPFTGRTFSYRFTATATAPTVMTLDDGEDGALLVRRPDGTITATATLG
ncbi:MAG: acyl dehydratase [Acidipropionibacterium acidipropionici]|uniref:acyl dehydratase n=1 Tax=Acidipropionibacterium acidipropionici TaxID=1748 RepID=UPI002F35FEEB